MVLSLDPTLTEETTRGLFFIQRYRFLTIPQFARVTGLHYKTAAGKLRLFEHMGLLGYFGNTRLGIHGKTPKAYFLTRKGFDLLREESGIGPELWGTYKEVKVESRWSPQMYHRLRTVDLLISLESAVARRPHLAIVQTLLEYKRVKRGTQIIHETLDYVTDEESAETKIIPDAAFILANTTTGRRALFFLETDMGSERIITASIGSKQTTLHRKFAQYDRYLQSFRYQQTYLAYGEFDSFTMLFVTPQDTRIEHIRRELSDLPADLGTFYRFTTFGQALGDFLGAIWHSRLATDRTRYPLVREEPPVSVDGRG